MIGSAKVAEFFDFLNLKRKIFSFSFSSLCLNPLPVEAGCKGKVVFSDFARGLENFFSVPCKQEVRRVRHASQPRSSIRFVLSGRCSFFQISSGPVAVLGLQRYDDFLGEQAVAYEIK